MIGKRSRTREEQKAVNRANAPSYHLHNGWKNATPEQRREFMRWIESRIQEYTIGPDLQAEHMSREAHGIFRVDELDSLEGNDIDPDATDNELDRNDSHGGRVI